MDAIKKRILGAVTVMDSDAAARLWEIISFEFSDLDVDWDAIPTAEPDEFDLEMLKAIEEDKDCREFVSSEEAKKMLGCI
ncbi:MAG: hypothetical protein GX256_09965 [Fretibacterium sp.]|nr:hypothetical protein [Fretibacterium sp.]